MMYSVARLLIHSVVVTLLVWLMGMLSGYSFLVIVWLLGALLISRLAAVLLCLFFGMKWDGFATTIFQAGVAVLVWWIAGPVPMNLAFLFFIIVFADFISWILLASAGHSNQPREGADT